MLPFDRLVQTMDNWAKHHPDVDVFCQIGGGGYIPTNMRWSRILTGSDFRKKVAECELMVAHAGTGSVFSAFEAAKPILLFPRYADLLEHTTDHQLHTAAWLQKRSGIIIAERDSNIDLKIKDAISNKPDIGSFSPWAPEEFISRIRSVIEVALE